MHRSISVVKLIFGSNCLSNNETIPVVYYMNWSVHVFQNVRREYFAIRSIITHFNTNRIDAHPKNKQLKFIHMSKWPKSVKIVHNRHSLS